MTYTLQTSSTPNQTPAASARRVFGRPRTIDSITIHWWDDPAKGPTFAGVVAWLRSKAARASAHYVAESGRVTRLVADRDVAWHAGTAAGNTSSIGIELNPRQSDGDYRTGADLIADLRAEHGDLPLLPHRHWKATACPGTYDLARLDRLARERSGGSTPTPTPAPAPSAGSGGYSGPSVVDYLRSIGRDSSYSARARLAAQHGITGYRGTAAQNTRLLRALRTGSSGSSSGSSGSSGSGSGYSGPSVVDYLRSIGRDSSYSARARLAAQHGITGYRGTAAQNTRLLRALRGH